MIESESAVLQTSNFESPVLFLKYMMAMDGLSVGIGAEVRLGTNFQMTSTTATKAINAKLALEAS